MSASKVRVTKKATPKKSPAKKISVADAALKPMEERAADAPTPVSQWKKHGISLLLPSGNTCLVRPSSMDTFMRNGVIPNPLMQLVVKAMSEGKPPSSAELFKEIDNDKMQALFELYDNVVVYVVIAPKIASTPGEDEERDEDVLYADDVDMDDKSFIFQWAVGGTSNVEQFREESREFVAAVSAGQDVGVPAK